MNRVVPFRALLGIFFLCVAVGARGLSAELTAELMADLKMVEDARISPDGQWVTYLVTDETSRDGKKSSELWIASADGALTQRRLLAESSRVAEARWSPDGRQLAVVLNADQSPRQRQLWLLDPESGTSKVLAMEYNGSGLEWSPDGRHLGFLGRDPSGPTPRRKSGEPRLLGVRSASSPNRFHRMDVANGHHHAVSPANYTISEYAWSPRNDAIVAVASEAAESGSRALWVFPFGSAAAARVLFPLREQTIGIAWSPDAKTIAWCSREFTPGSGQLQIIAASGEGGPRTVQADFPGSLHCITFRPDGRLVFGALENLRVGIYSIAADGSDLRADHPAKSFAPGSLGVGSFTKFGLSFSADGSRVASVSSGPDEPANVVAGAWRESLSRRTNLNPHVKTLSLGTVEDIAWRSFDGLEIHGFLVKPVSFDPKKKYPMVVEVHGGPRRSWWATCFLNGNHWAAWLARHGYVVLMPNPRGSEGRGAEFVRGNRQDLGGGDWQDIVSGLNHTIGLGFVDTKRLALAGWSYGGYLTAWGITQPEGQVFKAAIVGAGITNIFTRYGEGSATGGWAKDHWGDELALWTQSETFFKRSPIAQVAKVKAATLIIHGDNDSKVPHTQAIEFFNGLHARGVPVEGRIYPGEGHGISDRAHRIDLMQSIARWLGTHLGTPSSVPATQ